jgi:hypothetical protein
VVRLKHSRCTDVNGSNCRNCGRLAASETRGIRSRIRGKGSSSDFSDRSRRCQRLVTNDATGFIFMLPILRAPAFAGEVHFVGHSRLISHMISFAKGWRRRLRPYSVNRTDHRGSQSLRLRQADRGLCGSGSRRRFQWRATTRRLAIRLYWMWRRGWNYENWKVSVRTRDSPEIAMVCSKSPT